jgi:bifunctional DNA-binding transcriptional regulator/antitoxin component of YhaV-PrlF toxin-antitoxin module
MDVENRKICRRSVMPTTTIHLRRKGTITLPRELRRGCRLDEGDTFTVIGLGEGAPLLSPRVSDLGRLIDRVAGG